MEIGSYVTNCRKYYFYEKHNGVTLNKLGFVQYYAIN